MPAEESHGTGCGSDADADFASDRDSNGESSSDSHPEPDSPADVHSHLSSHRDSDGDRHPDTDQLSHAAHALPDTHPDQLSHSNPDLAPERSVLSGAGRQRRVHDAGDRPGDD